MQPSNPSIKTNEHPKDQVSLQHSTSDVINGFPQFHQPAPEVSYSCGSCGYPLHLSSASRTASGSGIASDYQKSVKKGFISFVSVDLSHFTQVDEVSCFPVSWGHRSKTKLLCRKCGVHIGYGYGDSSVLCGFDSPTLSNSDYRKFSVKIRALQPSEQC